VDLGFCGELKKAVKQVGSNEKDVEAHLKGRK
jgi:hypothetical protein